MKEVKPTFLSLDIEPMLMRGIDPAMAYKYRPTLNGEDVTCSECDTERGYADVIVWGQGPDRYDTRIHRLWGKVELRPS